VRTITTGLLGKRYKAERLKISFSAITGNEFQSSLFGANCKSRGFFTGLQRVARSFDKEKHRFSLEKGAFPTRRHPQGAERKASRSKSGGLPRRETAFARTSLAWSGRGWHYPLWRLIEKPRYLQKTHIVPWENDEFHPKSSHTYLSARFLSSLLVIRGQRMIDVSPLQGSDSPGGGVTQGVALGWDLSPLWGWRGDGTGAGHQGCLGRSSGLLTMGSKPAARAFAMALTEARLKAASAPMKSGSSRGLTGMVLPVSVR
jgi:hypothetical protein